MKNKLDTVFLIIFCLVFLIVANIYNFKTDVFNAPDEFGHFEYIRFLNLNHHFPALVNKTSFWEAHQPPLYYLLLSPIDYLLKNKITIESEVKFLRFFSSLFGALAIIFAFLTAKTLFKERVIYYSLTLAFALWPMFLFISGVLNNDVMANLLGVLMIYYLVKFNTEKYTNLRIIPIIQITNTTLLVCGAIVGLAFLTKLILWPVTLLFLAIIFWFSRNNIKNYLTFCLLPAFGILLFWIVRNLIFVGDLFGLEFIDKFWSGQYRNLLVFDTFVTWWKDLAKNFLGVFGYANIGLDPRIYRYFLYFAVTALIFWPIILFLYWRKSKVVYKNLIIGSCFFACLVATIFYYSWDKYQPQGRYLLLGLFWAVFYFVAFIIIFLPKKIRIVLPILIILVLGWINIDAFKHINWVNARTKKNVVSEKDNFALEKWNVKSGKWKRENNYYVYKKNDQDSFLRSYPNLRLDSNEFKKIFLKLKTEDFESVKINFKYFGEKDFDINNSVEEKLRTNNSWQKVDIGFLNLKKDDLIQIVAIEFRGKKEGSVYFDTISIE